MGSTTSFLQKLALVALGLIVSVVLLEIGLRAGGSFWTAAQGLRNQKALGRKGACRILCIGESTTAGEYPRYLEDILNQRHPGAAFSVIDRGILGTKTYTLLSRLGSELDAYRPDMVVAMMGVNDYGRHIPYEAISGSRIVNFLRSCRTYKLARLLGLRLHRFINYKTNIVQELPADTCHGRSCVEQGGVLLDRGEFAAAEKLFRKALVFDPQDIAAYVALGTLYRKQSRLLEAKVQYEKVIALDTRNDVAYAGLGNVSRLAGAFREASKFYQKAIEINPRNDEAYAGLGDSLRGEGKFFEAEQSLQKAIELNPGNYLAYVWLRDAYEAQGESRKAETTALQAIQHNPEMDRRDRDYVHLGDYYRSRGQYDKAVALLERFAAQAPHNDRTQGALKTLYAEMGDVQRSEMHGDRAQELRSDLYNPSTAANYRALRDVLRKRGVVLVCVQYPMRDLASLRKMFRGDSEGILFVDNEALFRDAVRRDGYSVYFRDMFGGDFGHCTEKGNRLLAGHIADTILGEVFHEIPVQRKTET